MTCFHLSHVDGVNNKVISNAEMMPGIFWDLFMLPVLKAGASIIKMVYISRTEENKKGSYCFMLIIIILVNG